MEKHRTERKAWNNMKARTTNPDHHAWDSYGGRGIKVCPRWLNSFEKFFKDLGPRPSKRYSLDRIDNDLGYSCGRCKWCIKRQLSVNCRWATRKQQQRNTRANLNLTYKGKTQTLADWAEEYKVPYPLLRDRVSKEGWTLKRALHEPLDDSHRPKSRESHLKTGTPEYNAWCHVRDVGCCPRWKDFGDFYSDVGERPSNEHILARHTLTKKFRCGRCARCKAKNHKRNGRWALANERVNPNSKLLTYKGKTQSIAAWARAHDMTAAALGQRLLGGSSLKEALKKPPRKTVLYVLGGKSKTLAEWCRKYKAKMGLVYHRVVKKGWDLREALTTPAGEKP